MRHHSYFLQEFYEPKTRTRRGFGTGRGRTKGIPNRYNSKVRQAIAAAKSALEAGIPLNDVVCRLLKIAIEDPETFQGVLDEVPLCIAGRPRKKPHPTPSVDVFENVREPTDSEIADTLGLPVETVTRIRLSGSDTYEFWRDKVIRQRMSPAQRELFETLEYQNVLNSYREAMREQQAARKQKRFRKRLNRSIS